jgi:TPR repeat protein
VGAGLGAAIRRGGSLLAITLALPGCAAFTGVPPSDMSAVHVGSSRSTVQQVLGEPVAAMDDGCGTVETYSYDRGAEPLEPIYSLAMFHPAAPFVVGLIAHPFVVYGQESEINVAFGPDGDVVAYSPAEYDDWSTLVQKNQLWSEGDGPEEIAERYYRIGLAHWRQNPVARSCLCRSAQMGHAGSQFQLARLYRLAPPSRDNTLSAYTWYAVAERHGADHAAEERSAMAAGMTAEERLGAERAALAWQPDPAMCRAPATDGVVAQAG